MEALTKYREAVLTIITPSPTGRYFSDSIKESLIADRENDKYVLIRTGWAGNENYYSVILHMEIVDGLIYLYINNTDREIEEELEEEGVDNKDIISAYFSPEMRSPSNSNI